MKYFVDYIRNKNILFFIVISLIILLGIIFRVKAYLTIRPLWLDECFLFHNIYEKNYWSFFSELLWNQSAPPLFLIIEKTIVSVFGIKEMSLRLFPFICSLISLPVFYVFSKQFLDKKYSIIIANFIFAINIYLVFYAQELKQYSSDVLVFMLLFILLKNLTIKDFDFKKYIYYLLITIIFPLLSIISYFLIPAWAMLETIKYKFKYVKNLLLLHIPFIILSIFYYIYTLNPQKHQILDVSKDFWMNGFLSFNFLNNTDIIKNLIVYIFEPCKYPILQLSLIVIGIILFIKNYRKSNCSFILLTFLLIIFASILNVYPIYQRAALYIFPLIIVFLAKSFDSLSVVTRNRKIYSVVIIMIFLFSFSNYNLNYFKDRFYGNVISYSNAKLAMKTLKEKYNPEDIVIILYPSKAEYLYYKLYYNFNPQTEIYTKLKFPTEKQVKNELNKITKKEGKYWIFYSIEFTKTKIIKKALKQWNDKYKVLYENKTLNSTSNSYILYLQK